MRTYIKAKFGPPKLGEKRTIEKFAWLPKKIITYDGEHQNRKLINYYWIWFERYKEEQECVELMIPSLHDVMMIKSGTYDWELRRRYQ